MEEYSNRKRNAKTADFKQNDLVLLKKEAKLLKKTEPRYETEAYTVDVVKGSMITASNRKHTVTRNSSFFKKMGKRGDHLKLKPKQTRGTHSNTKENPIVIIHSAIPDERQPEDAEEPIEIQPRDGVPEEEVDVATDGEEPEIAEDQQEEGRAPQDTPNLRRGGRNRKQTNFFGDRIP